MNAGSVAASISDSKSEDEGSSPSRRVWLWWSWLTRLIVIQEIADSNSASHPAFARGAG